MAIHKRIRQLLFHSKPTERRGKLLPPRLPTSIASTHLLPDDHHLSRFPVTRYWHRERHKEIFGLAAPGVPHWLQRFDWLVGWPHGWANTKQGPRHVYCHPLAMNGLLHFLRSRRAPALPASSFLVVGGEDTLLSTQKNDTLRGLGELFEDIYYEAYDAICAVSKLCFLS